MPRTQPPTDDEELYVPPSELKAMRAEQAARKAKAEALNSPYVTTRVAAIGRVVAAFLIAASIVAAALILAAPSKAQPDPYWPIPPVWCPGGGTSTGWGGFCNGAVYPDGTQWHQDSFVAPFVGRVYNPIVCVVANTPAPPPLAGPSGCGR